MSDEAKWSLTNAAPKRIRGRVSWDHKQLHCAFMALDDGGENEWTGTFAEHASISVRMLTVMAMSAATFAPPESARCASALCRALPSSWMSIKRRLQQPSRRHCGRPTRQKRDSFVISASATMRARPTRRWTSARAIGNAARSTRSRESMAQSSSDDAGSARSEASGCEGRDVRRRKSRVRALRALFSWANEAEENDGQPDDWSQETQVSVKWAPHLDRQGNSEVLRAAPAKVASASRARFAALYDRPPPGWRQHIRDGRVRFRQAKNEHRNPIDIHIPLHPALAESVAAAKVSTNMTFLLTEFGKPFTANGFGNKFKDWCRQADLPHCSAHDVREATSTALAESGATPHQIMAITGHQSLEEVERYTKAANRKKNAGAARAKLSCQ